MIFSQFFLVITLQLVILCPLIYIVFFRKVDLFSPLVGFCAVYWIYFGFPSLFYLFYKPVFFPNTGYYLSLAAFYEIIGAISFYLGWVLFNNGLGKKFFTRILEKVSKSIDKIKLPDKRFNISALIIFALISLISFLEYMHLVGGFKYYITHLGATNVLSVGKVYLIWGVVLIKIIAIVLLSLLLFYKKTPGKYKLLTFVFSLFAIAVVGLIGARQMVVVGIIEIAIILNYSFKKLSLIAIVLLSVIVIAFVLIYGEYRIHTFVKGQSFLNQLETTYSSFDTTAYRLTDNYFDSVRTFSMVLYYTNTGKLNYESGRTYLSVLVQPIPRKFRPIIQKDNSGKYFCAGGKGYYCRVISSLGEFYLNFSYFGIVLGMFVFGYISAIACWFFYSRDRKKNSYPWYVVFYSIFFTGLFVFIRGYFVGAMTSILMDFVPVLILLLIFYFLDKRKNANRN